MHVAQHLLISGTLEDAYLLMTAFLAAGFRT